jgi:hypothetical protein
MSGQGQGQGQRQGQERALRRLRPLTAISLESLVVWAYRDQLVDKMTARSLDSIERQAEGRDLGYQPSPFGSGALVERAALLGTKVDGGGRSWECHRDAELLHEVVCGMPPLPALLIARYGRTGAAPEWRTTDPAPFAVPVAESSRSPLRHKIELHWYRIEGHRPKIRRGESAELVNIAPGIWDLGCRACPIVYYPPLDYVKSMRDEYAAWHDAMQGLLQRLADAAFRDHRLTGFAAPRSPWDKRDRLVPD